MDISIEVLSSVEIPRDELIAVLTQAGAEAANNPDYDYRLARGKAALWIAFLEGENELPDPEHAALIEQKLGGAVRTRLLIDIRTTPGSSQLTIDLCCRLAEQWPLVVDDLGLAADPIYTGEELCEMRRLGLGFGRPNLATLKEDSQAGGTYDPRWLEPFIPPAVEHPYEIERENQPQEQAHTSPTTR